MNTKKQIFVTSIGDVSAKGNVTIGVSIRKGFAKKSGYILSDEAGISDLVDHLKLDDPAKLINSEISDLCGDFTETTSTFMGDDGVERTTLWLQP